MQGGRWWCSEILPPFPSVHPWSSSAEKVSKRRVEFGFEAAQQWTLFLSLPPIIIKPLGYTYMEHTGAGLNPTSLSHRDRVLPNPPAQQVTQTRGLLTAECSVLWMLSWLWYCTQPWHSHRHRHAKLNRKYQRSQMYPYAHKHTREIIQYAVQCMPKLSDRDLF